MQRTMPSVVLVVSLWLAASAQAEEKVLFDFGDPAQVQAWQMYQLPKPEKGRAPEPEPEAKLELSVVDTGAGRRDGRLQITYAGGWQPTIAATQIPEDLTPYEAIKLDVTVPRAMVVGLRILQEKDKPGPNTPAWGSTTVLKPGTNTVSFSMKKAQRFRTRVYSDKEGKAVLLQFYVYRPVAGEVVILDNVRVSTEDDANADNKTTPNSRPKDGYKVLGTELTVRDVDDLGARLAPQWQKPEKNRTIEEREVEFVALYNEFRKTHPKAVMVTLRQGQKGFDPANPEVEYAGWDNVHVNSHGPDGIPGRASNGIDRYGSLELFMRHRSQLIRIDVSSIPKGAKVLAARLLLASGAKPADKPNMFAAEACNRPWVESEVDAYQYAAGKLWHNVSGQYYDGDDPDYLPLYLAYGPAEGETSVWDFTRAVKRWTEEGHPNHGFFLHGDAKFYARTFTKRANDVTKRPALVVIYEP
ncbi:MAG TPA: DNRLRE domain-containing protein [Planctomycetota bacterium]|nr:DNRLRE domain-containing protein [Planctomycetota bacterium]